jgi:formylmethanofuran dehydrogenase subunit C
MHIFYNDGSIPAAASSADVIMLGDVSGSYFGTAMVSGDLNNDGRTDLIVGANQYATNVGRTYIFYNDGSIPTNPTQAEVIINGYTVGNYFGYSMTSGDFNSDGKVDLAVAESASSGRVMIFYNNNKIVADVGGADVIITGEASAYFGCAMTSGDFNGDGRTDLAVGAYAYNTSTGRAYVFYNDGTIPILATNADIIISGQATSSLFGSALASGDFDLDGKDDLIVGAPGFFTNYGRAYVFYMDGSVPTADSADIRVTGETTNNYLGNNLVVGDLNNDSKLDLVVGAYGYSTNTGRAYIFYNDGNIAEMAQNADVIITGEMTNAYFGNSLAVKNLNSDNKMDLAVGSWGYDSNKGRAYIFYQDGTFATVAGNADVLINGDATGRFGYSLDAGDLNNDGKDDLIVGSHYSSFYNATGGGAVCIFYNDGVYPSWSLDADILIGGEFTNSNFGFSLSLGDFDGDGREDLAVGAPYYTTNIGRAYVFYLDKVQSEQVGVINNDGNNSGIGYAMASGDLNDDGVDDLVLSSNTHMGNTGRVYIFYSDGSISTTADGADVKITGEAANNYFGYRVKVEDMNGDGKVDLLVGSYGNSKVYIFYNDGSYPSAALGAELIFTGTSNFGFDFVAGDFNNDTRKDLAVGAWSLGNIYIFYNDGSMPTTSATADVTITDGTSNRMGYAMDTGDFNNDGIDDIVAGANDYNNLYHHGRVVIFYCDGSIPTTGATADVLISGNNDYYFGWDVLVGDFDADGDDDLATSLNSGAVYLIYNDGSYPSSYSGADVVITGEIYFGQNLFKGDIDNDGDDDLIASSYYYNANYTGRVCVFYNDGSYPTTAATANLIITGEAANNYFSYALTTWDYDDDGDDDLVAGAYSYNSSQGRTYVFYNDGTIPTTAATADITITGESNTTPTTNYFGYALVAGDMNNDGKDDLAVGAYGWGTNNVGRVFIFYNDSVFNTDVDQADVIIEGNEYSSGGNFGFNMVVGDINNDNYEDLIVAAAAYSNGAGRIYFFYGDTSNNYGNTACTGSNPVICQSGNADAKVTGETSGAFGSGLVMGDFNYDGKEDLAVGSPSYSSDNGRAYIFYNDVVFPVAASSASVIIASSSATSRFGVGMTAGDYNLDGRVDLVVGSWYYSSQTGRAYIFYNDGTIPTTSATADVIITGEATSNFGYALTSGDFDADGDTDLAAGAFSYSGTSGRTYIFYSDGTNNFGSIACTGSAPTTCNAVNADVLINSESSGTYFGGFLTTADLNNDNKDDLVVSNYQSRFRAYVFYNDGFYPSSSANADVVIGGEGDATGFGKDIAIGDFNSDNVKDLAIGASGFNSNQGKVFMFNLTTAKPRKYMQTVGGVGFSGDAEFVQ